MKLTKSSLLAKFALLLCVQLVPCVSSYATSIATTLVGPDTPPSFHTGSAYDSSTGKYYRRNYFSAGLLVYNNQSDFEANINSTPLALGGGGTAGTYFSVMNGKVYSRSDTSSNSVSMWDAGTGSPLGSTTVTAMEGLNGAGTFNWGGYSGMNFMDDGASLYLFGKSNSASGWIVDKMDANLNILSSLTYTPSSLGYSFIINGTLFTGSSFASPTVNSAMDLSTGLESVVNFTLTGLAGSPYLTNFDYVSATDTLYIHDNGDGNMYKIDGAASAFGVPGTSVPDAGTSAMLVGSAMVGLVMLRRRYARR